MSGEDEDWLKIETPENWLSVDATIEPTDEQPSLGMALVIPETAKAQLTLLQECWDRLKPRQQVVMNAWREARWNLRGALRALSSTQHKTSKNAVVGWMSHDDFGFVLKVLRNNDSKQVLDTDKLLLRQEDIIEQLMTPTPILHQGMATGYFENRAPQASKANEVLMKVAGLLKNDDQTTRHVVRFVHLAGPEVQQAIEVATEIT